MSAGGALLADLDHVNAGTRAHLVRPAMNAARPASRCRRANRSQASRRTGGLERTQTVRPNEVSDAALDDRIPWEATRRRLAAVTCTSKHSVSGAGVIVDDAGRALLVRRRDNGRWEPPGGVLELDESIYDGLRREVREETGLDVEPERLTGVYKNMTRGIVALVFRCRLTGGNLATGPNLTPFTGLTQPRFRHSCPLHRQFPQSYGGVVAGGQSRTIGAK